MDKLMGKTSSGGGSSPQRGTLEEMPEAVRSRYAQILAAEALADGRLDPREIEYLYTFMSRMGLGPTSRAEVRRSLEPEGDRSVDLVALVEEVVSEAPGHEEEIAVSLVKDVMRMSRADGAVSPEEEANVKAVAEARFGERAERIIEVANRTIDYEEALLKGDVDLGELEKGLKDIAALAAAASVPITALFFIGSVVGLSAAGITSGLAALGLGGILGLSAMVTGIGAVVVLGVAGYAAARWAMGGKERELARRREHMIQEVLKSHQGAIEDLAEDIGAIALKLAEYVSRSDQNEARLARLQEELRAFNAALEELKQGKDNLEAGGGRLAFS